MCVDKWKILQDEFHDTPSNAHALTFLESPNQNVPEAYDSISAVRL